MLFATATPFVRVDEATRLSTLKQHQLLPSLPESVFNEFVALAGRIFNLPVSLLALVDADEVAYKASVGLPGMRRQARAEAICSQVVACGKVLLFTDLAQALPPQLPAGASLAARQKGLHFYAGAPLRTANQSVIGTLCVLGPQPRPCSDHELQLLEHLAQLVERVIMVRHECLTSRWLGQEYWRLTQEYIASSLNQVSSLLTARPAPPANAPVDTATLLRVLQRLNELSWVLAEPLPSFV